MTRKGLYIVINIYIYNPVLVIPGYSDSVYW